MMSLLGSINTASENRVKISEFGDKATGVEAICKTLKEKEFIPKDDECIETNAKLIGAKKLSIRGCNCTQL